MLEERLEDLKWQLLHSSQLYSWRQLEAEPALLPPVSGVYGWFFRSVPSVVPTQRCFTRDGMTLLYVGVAPGRPTSSETLRSRLRFHYLRHAEGSTLRLTLGCLL